MQKKILLEIFDGKIEKEIERDIERKRYGLRQNYIYIELAMDKNEACTI